MNRETIYRDRTHAGQILAEHLSSYSDQPDILVLGIPRGGIPVAFEVARILRAPLDVFLVRKIGSPENPELALGAIASGGVRVWNESVVEHFPARRNEMDEVIAAEMLELKRRETLYRHGRGPLTIEGKIIILVDDGLATGASMRAALIAVRAHRPARIVIAVPVGAPETCKELAREVNQLICPLQPEEFRAVGFWYTQFPQTTDQEVQAYLDELKSGHSGMALS